MSEELKVDAINLPIKLQEAQEENELLMLKLRTIHEAARV